MCFFGGASFKYQRMHYCLCISRPGCKQPCSSLPSSSPMRSSFQVQQSSINLIHSPTPSSGREPAAFGRQRTGVRPPVQPARRSCCCASVPSLRRYTQLPFACCCLHVSAALHSRELPANEASKPGRGRVGLANQDHSLVN